MVEQNNITVDEIIQKPTKTRPRAPFLTSTLQQSASTRLSFNVKRTMRTAQKLYEAGYITYMRIDAPSLSKDSIEDARNYINQHFGEKYIAMHQRFILVLKMPKKPMRQLGLQMHL